MAIQKLPKKAKRYLYGTINSKHLSVTNLFAIFCIPIFAKIDLLHFKYADMHTYFHFLQKVGLSKPVKTGCQKYLLLWFTSNQPKGKFLQFIINDVNRK